MRSQLSLSPTLLLDLRLEAGYTFTPFGGDGRTGEDFRVTGCLSWF